MTTQLFATCLVDSLFPEVGQAVVEVLHQVGEEVLLPYGQTCCGQPAFNAGYCEQARRMAKHTIEVFEAYAGPVVVPSGSCAAMLRHGYREIFSGDPVWLQRAEALAERTFELSQFLVDVLERTDLEANYSGAIGYHASCHALRALGIDRQPASLLEACRDAVVERLSDECCGFGGIFAVELPEVSTEMLNKKLEEIENSQADVVVSCDVSCLMQIEGGLRRRGSSVRCSHLAQILAGQEPGLR